MDMVMIGASGPSVELLQTGLNRAGYLYEAPDGVFGSVTASAVRRFQASSGIARDGVAGIETWSRVMPYLVGYVRHSISRGDTLYLISRANHSSVDAILTANPGIDAQNLQPGRVVTVPFAFDLVPTNIHFTYDVLQLCLEGLLARYPFLTLEIIGTTNYNRNLYAVHIGEGEKKVMYNASHHANEWITTPLVMKFLEEYAKALALESSIGGVAASILFSYAEIIMAPMVNPDGVDLVTGLLQPGNVQYENALALSRNYPGIPFPSGWKANLAGVDLNLNYPAYWEDARRIKSILGFTEPGPRDFVGSAPLTQPEALAMYEATIKADPMLVLAYHTQGEVIYWQFHGYETTRSYEIANELSRVSGYLVENTPYESSFAGYKDWFLMQYRRPGYTIEAGLGENPLPISQFDKIYADNVGILVNAALLA